MNEEDAFDQAVDATVEQVAVNAQRMDVLLETLYRRLAQSYTHVTLAIGVCMIIGGFLHIWLRQEFSFSLTAMVWGAIIVALSLFFHMRVGKNLVVFGQALKEIDQERNEHARKLEIIEQLFQKGVPSGVPIQQLIRLLGESGTRKSDGDHANHDARPDKN